MKKWLLIIVFLTLYPLTIFSAEPFFAFEKKGPAGVSPVFQAWHSEFEKNGDYSESWFFYVQTDEGAGLFALMSITNLGVRTFDALYDINFYAPNGKTYDLHKEYKRSDISASISKMEVKIAKARAWGGGNSYHMTVDEPEFKIRLDIENILPPHKFGDGLVKFYQDKSRIMSFGLNTPNGRASGSITVSGKTFNLAGYAYHDHCWATIKIPAFVRQWYTLRVLNPKYTIILHHQYLTEEFGKDNIRFGLLGVDGKIAASIHNFSYKPKKWRSQSDFKIPTELEISINAGEYKVSGTIAETRFLAAIDVLGQISWPVRMLIKAFYTNPYIMRYLGKYELDITNKMGETEHISGIGLIEANYY